MMQIDEFTHSWVPSPNALKKEFSFSSAQEDTPPVDRNIVITFS